MRRKTAVRRKLHVRAGDLVMVMAGKDKGKKGKVLRAIPEKGAVVVEGINIVKKHQKPTQKMPQGGIIEKEAPMASSKVMPVCSKCNRPTRVGKKTLETGRVVRVCKQCGEVMDK